MHQQHIRSWRHEHLFNQDKKKIERKTFIVVIVTLAMMAAEIFFGWLTHSMALLADGWHMGTHAFALGISLTAYVLARKYARDDKFTFGTWKIEILGAYTSAIVLGLVGILLIFTSVERLIDPGEIRYNQALLVAAIGLVVNVACALILRGGHKHLLGRHHGHHHGPEGEEPSPGQPHDHDHHHEAGLTDPVHTNLNLKSAYLHVIADAVTSVFAIVALLGAKYGDLNWLDPFMGMVGAVMILRWSAYLLKDAGSILLDRHTDFPVIQEITASLESDGETKISDLHVWKVADEKYACIVSLVTGQVRSLEEYRARLREVPELAHVTIEVNPCQPSFR
jgi:cation diffusion facilitator family transporter